MDRIEVCVNVLNEMAKGDCVLMPIYYRRIVEGVASDLGIDIVIQRHKGKRRMIAVWKV